MFDIDDVRRLIERAAETAVRVAQEQHDANGGHAGDMRVVGLRIAEAIVALPVEKVVDDIETVASLKEQLRQARKEIERLKDTGEALEEIQAIIERFYPND